VHGDFHPGNVRGTADEFVILDWGDSGIGQPMIDQLAFCRRLTAADRAAAEDVWAAEWQRIVPGSDAGRAAALLAPVAALNAAVVYQSFLDSIEPDERPYHKGDPVEALREAIRATG
jgi:aminoglycoside phosphotransferase (APT) family kinase protein